MYIRSTTTRKAADGTSYSTFRIVSSERIGGRVRQKTILNIGSHFDLPADAWGRLCVRIEEILEGKLPLCTPSTAIETLAQEFAARIIAESSATAPKTAHKQKPEYEEIDVTSLALTRPRSVGVEHAALHAVRQLKLPEILQQAGFVQSQTAMAVAGIIGRMTMPGSERATWTWLTERSALGELLDVDFGKKSVMSLYRMADLLVSHRKIIEKALFEQALSLFSLQETITM
jgi:hypothetical protein